MEPAGARGAPTRASLGWRWELDAEGVSPRGDEAQELCHPLQQHVAAALQQPALQQLSGHRERGPRVRLLPAGVRCRGCGVIGGPCCRPRLPRCESCRSLSASPAARSALRTASCLGHGVARGKRLCAGGPRRPQIWVARLVSGHGDDDATGHEAVEGGFRHTPTWCAKCRILGSGRPLRFEHWGARGDFAFYLPVPHRIAMNLSYTMNNTGTRGLYWFRPPLWCNTLIQCVVWWIASWA